MSYLSDFLFSPARANSPLRTLSGGERNRVLLARLLALPANVLVLDEPTNDLDIDTLELLEELLQAYAGTVFLVSHDRRFLDNVVTSTIAWEGDLAPGLWREYEGGYEDWKLQKARAAGLRDAAARSDCGACIEGRCRCVSARQRRVDSRACRGCAGQDGRRREAAQAQLQGAARARRAAGAHRGARSRAEGARRAARQRRALRRGPGSRRGGADALCADRRRAARCARALGGARHAVIDATPQRVGSACRIAARHPTLDRRRPFAAGMIEITMATTAPCSPWRLATRTARMNPSAIREILKLTELPGIISLAGGLPSPDLSGRGRARGDDARAARHAARGAAICGERGLRAAARMGRGRDGAPGPAVTPAQVLITTGSQQGLDLVGKVLIDAGSRVAVESPTYLGALQAFAPYEPRIRGRRRRRRRAAARRAGLERRRRALPLRAAELPEPERSLDLGRPPRRARRRRSERRRADRRGQPVRRPLVRRRAAGADRFALARRDDLSRHLLEGPRARASPRLRGRARRAVRQAGAGQAGGRPAHAGLQPAHRPRDGPRRLSRCPRADDPQPLPRPARRDAGRARRAPADLGPLACRWQMPGGGMFFWVELPAGVDARRCWSRRWRAASPSFPARPSTPARRDAEHAAPVVRDGRRRRDRARHRRPRRALRDLRRPCRAREAATPRAEVAR